MSRDEGATVVGNGVAGHACARRLAERGVPVTLIGPGVPFDRPPLSKRALVRGVLPVLADVARLAALGIHVVDGLVEQVDPARRTLLVQTRRELLDIRYDRLVWATGLATARPPIAGLAAADDLTTAAGFRRLLSRVAVAGRHVTVIGAGLIGCEAAATLSQRHHVTLLDTSTTPLPRLHERIGAAARRALADAGVRFVGGCLVEAVEQRNRRVVAVRTTTHGRIRADVVVTAAGVAGTVDRGLGGGRCLQTDERLQRARAGRRLGLWRRCSVPAPSLRADRGSALGSRARERGVRGGEPPGHGEPLRARAVLVLGHRPDAGAAARPRRARRQLAAARRPACRVGRSRARGLRDPARRPRPAAGRTAAARSLRRNRWMTS